jgi:hypothetical protein
MRGERARWNCWPIGIVDTQKFGLVQKQEQFTIYTNYGKDRNKLNAGEWQQFHCRMLLHIALSVTDPSVSINDR